MDITSFEDGKILYQKVFGNMKYNPSENFVLCGLVPSLEHIVLVKIAIILFQNNIRNKVDQFFNLHQYLNAGEIRCYEILNLVQNNVLANNSLDLTFPYKDSVEQLIKSIRDKTEEFFYEHINTCIFNSSAGVNDAKKVILASFINLCWTQDGKINILKTMVNIIENANLGIIDKYILACNNCLVDKIQNLFNIIPESLINNLINNNNEYPLVTYWTKHFKGEVEQHGVETYEYLLKWTIQNHKKLAWHFFWENFTDHEMRYRNLNLVQSNEYISLPYLFISMKPYQIEYFFSVKRVGIYFTDMLDQISKSCKIVLVPYYLIDYIKTHEVCVSYEIINRSWVNNYITTNEYFKIWEEFTPYIINKNVKNFYFWEKFDAYLYVSIIVAKDWQTTKFLLRLLTLQEIKNFIYDYSFRICYELICQSTERFNKIIKLLLIYEEEISEFKNSIFSDIYCKLIINDKFEIMQEILFVFCSKEGRREYKNELPFKNNASIILRILKSSKDSNLLNLLNKFISWCYNGNDEEVTRCKAIIFDLETQMYVEHKEEFFNIFEDLIRTEKWDIVDKFFEWIFFATNNLIDSTESKCERFKFIFNHKIGKTNCLLLLRFITSCFEQREYDQLRGSLTNKIILIAVQNLLNIDAHQEAENLLEWRFSSNEKRINKFKDLFILIMGRKILFKIIKYHGYIVQVEALFNWYKPSITSANSFKESFVNYFENKRRLQLNFLKRAKKRTNRRSRVWNILRRRMDQSLSLLSNYVEEQI